MTTKLATSAMSALLTTISHWPLVTIGLSTGVSGEANAGTCSIRRTRIRQDVLLDAFDVFGVGSWPPTVFSDNGDPGHTMDGGLSVDVGEIGPCASDVTGGERTSGIFSLWLWLSEAATVELEPRCPPRRYIATLRGPHLV